MPLGSQKPSPSDRPRQSPCPTTSPSPSPSPLGSTHHSIKGDSRRAIRTRRLSVYECVQKMDGAQSKGYYEPGGDDACWLWWGPLDQNGYGVISGMRAHRVMVVAQLGYDIEGLSVDHLCRERRCVNPKHLDPVPMWLNLSRIPGDVRAASIKARSQSGLCSRGHDDWAPHPNGSGAVWCVTCMRQSNKERDELIRQAAASLGISQSDYRRRYGGSRAAARGFVQVVTVAA